MAGYDISASVSEASTLGLNNRFGAFTVGGNSGTKWLPLALFVAAVLGFWFWLRKKN